MTGAVVTHLGKPQLPHCKSTTRFGYWDGRFRGPNFPGPHCSARYCTSLYRIDVQKGAIWRPNFQIPNLGRISMRKTTASVDKLSSRRLHIDWGRRLLLRGRRIYPDGYLRLKSATEMVDSRPRNSRQFKLYIPLSNRCLTWCDSAFELSKFPTFGEISMRRSPSW